MPFDVDELLAYCRERIARFAHDHSSETFYAFAIDANMLCLNSVEQFAKTLHKYQSRWDRRTRSIIAIADLTDEDLRDEKHRLDLAELCKGLDRSNPDAVLAEINKGRSRDRSKGCEYRTPEGIRGLRENTGDWAYQGFAKMNDEHGFDRDLYYNVHYYEAMDSEDGHAPHTQYAIAMTELVGRLRSSDAFKPLQLTDDFTVSWVDHNY
jgi:hypothetical protein